MSWTVWILSSAVMLAFYDIAKKASVRDNAVLPTLFFSTIFGFLAFSIGMAGRGALATVLRPEGRVLLLALLKTAIVSASWIFTFTALRTLPVTIATPIRASAPALVFLAALFCYGEVPTVVQGIGMVSVLAGYWAFSWAGRCEGIDFLRSRAVWCAVAGAVLSAVSSIWDKYVFQVASAPLETVQFWFQFGLVCAYGVPLAVQRGFRLPHRGFRLPQRGFRLPRSGFRLPHRGFQWRWTIPFVGILLAGADWLYFNGVACPDVPISVASLMRRFSVVITFAVGALVFRERNLLRKGLALTAVLFGIVLLAL